MTEKLEPCPFCGDTEVEVQQEDIGTGTLETAGYVVVCSCDAKGPSNYAGMGKKNHDKAISGAITEWNTRNPCLSPISAGTILPGTGDFPEGLVAVPVVQLQRIQEQFRELIHLSLTHIRDFDTQSKEITELKHKIFGLAEFGVLFAGNWLQHIPKGEKK